VIALGSLAKKKHNALGQRTSISLKF